GRVQRSGRTAHPVLPNLTNDGSALALTASASRRVCQPSASPLRCRARLTQRSRATAGNQCGIFAWSENLGQSRPGEHLKRKAPPRRRGFFSSSLRSGEDQGGQQRVYPNLALKSLKLKVKTQ